MRTLRLLIMWKALFQASFGDWRITACGCVVALLVGGVAVWWRCWLVVWLCGGVADWKCGFVAALLVLLVVWWCHQ